MDLRANTAVDVLIGPFVDITDGNTTEDALTLTQAEIKLSKLGQALTQKNETTSAAFDDDGYYNCMLDATDTNTEGQLVIIIHQAANALPVRHEFDVLSEAAYDSLYVAKDDGFMDVNIKTIGRLDTQETEADNLESACSNYSVTRGLTGTALPAAAADGVGGVPISDAGGLDLDTQLAETNEVTAARMGALTDWLNGGRLDLLLDAIPTAAENADAIWDETLSGHNGAGSTGKALRQIKEGAISVESTINDAGASTTVFITNLTEATDDHYIDVSIVFIDGVLIGQSRPILSYDGGTKAITLDEALTEAPGDGDGFIIKTDHVHPVTQINTNVLAQVNAALDTAIAELGVAAPTATPNLRTGLMLLYMALRNKLDITATTKEVHNNSGTQITSKTLSDDGTTYSEAEMA